MFNKMFDFNRDGELDAVERALEYMNFRAITGEDDSDYNSSSFENDDHSGDNYDG